MTTQPPMEGATGPLGWYRRANKKVLAGIVVIVVAVAALIVTNLGDALTYYNTVDELKADPQAVEDRRRVGGRVLEGSIEKDAENNLSFTIYHNEVTNTLPVHYRGVVPDIFDDEVDVIVEGEWRRDGIFYASNLIAQHPPEFQVAEPGSTHAPVER